MLNPLSPAVLPTSICSLPRHAVCYPCQWLIMYHLGAVIWWNSFSYYFMKKKSFFVVFFCYLDVILYWRALWHHIPVELFIFPFFISTQCHNMLYMLHLQSGWYIIFIYIVSFSKCLRSKALFAMCSLFTHTLMNINMILYMYFVVHHLTCWWVKWDSVSQCWVFQNCSTDSRRCITWERTGWCCFKQSCKSKILCGILIKANHRQF